MLLHLEPCVVTFRTKCCYIQDHCYICAFNRHVHTRVANAVALRQVPTGRGKPGQSWPFLNSFSRYGKYFNHGIFV